MGSFEWNKHPGQRSNAIDRQRSRSELFNIISTRILYPQYSNRRVSPISSYLNPSLLLNNLDEGTHPFHLHGHKFWVLAQGDGDYKNTTVLDPNPIFRDTVAVRMSTSNGANAEGYGFTLIRFITDNPGAWALHCHITWHMEAGLLATFLVGGSVALQKQIDTAPAAWAALCST